MYMKFEHLYIYEEDDINLYEENVKNSITKLIENIGKICNFRSLTTKKNMYGNFDNLYLFKETNKEIKAKFVGFLCVDNKMIISLPKSFKKQNDSQYEKEKTANLLKKVFLKYHNKLQIRDKLYARCTNDFNYNKISIARKLGCLFQKRGLYTKLQSVFNISHGKTHWGKTVSTIRADIIDGVPFYSKFIRRTVHGEDTEVTNIHRSVLHHIFKENSLESLFPFKINIERPTLKFQSIIDNKKYYIYLLQKEISCIFDDDFIEVFKNIICFINNASSLNKNNSFEMYGVMNFEYVFELMLGDFLENCLEYKIIDSKLQVSFEKNKDINRCKYIEDQNISEEIEWKKNYLKFTSALNHEEIFWPYYYQLFDETMNENANIGRQESFRTKFLDKLKRSHCENDNKGILVPDIAVSYKTNSMYEYAIIDAKYYAEGKFPEARDIHKQILYKDLFQLNLDNKQITNSYNCFFLSQSNNFFKEIQDILFIGLGHVMYQNYSFVDVVGVNVDLLMNILTKNINIQYNKGVFFKFLNITSKTKLNNVFPVVMISRESKTIKYGICKCALKDINQDNIEQIYFE